MKTENELKKLNVVTTTLFRNRLIAKIASKKKKRKTGFECFVRCVLFITQSLSDTCLNYNFVLVLFKQRYCTTLCVWHIAYLRSLASFVKWKTILVLVLKTWVLYQTILDDTQPYRSDHTHSLCGTQPQPLDIHLGETHTVLIYNEQVSRDCDATSDP